MYAVLDPTLKMDYFKNHKWPISNIKKIKSSVREEFLKFYEIHEQKQVEATSSSLFQDNNDLLAHIYHNPKQDVQNEFDQYLRTSTIPIQVKGVVCDRLSWWNVNGLSKFKCNFLICM